MSEVTLEAIAAKQAELAAMIQKLQQPVAQVTYIEIEETTVTLNAGERYAGALLDDNGETVCHLVLMAQRPDKKLNWQAATDWAESVGGTLPTRQEQALLFANCKPHLKPEWHWSSQAHEDDASYAWSCDFGLGCQDTSLKSYEGGAVAVRRV